MFELYNHHFFDIPAHLSARGIPAALADIIARCVAKAPNARYENGLALLHALDRAWASIVDEMPDMDMAPGNRRLIEC